MSFLDGLNRVIRRPLLSCRGPRRGRVRRGARPLTLEVLESRTLLSVSLPDWRSPPEWANTSTATFSGGALVIRDDGETIRETFTAAGFLDMTIDGQEHTSDPKSAF